GVTDGGHRGIAQRRVVAPEPVVGTAPMGSAALGARLDREVDVSLVRREVRQAIRKPGAHELVDPCLVELESRPRLELEDLGRAHGRLASLDALRGQYDHEWD